MIKVLTIEQIRAVEAAADASGLTYDAMMQAAGQAVAERVLEYPGPLEDARVTVLVGPGNNGGDGLVAGRVIAEKSSAQVRFYLLKSRDENDANYKAVRDAGLFVADAENDHDLRVLRNMVASADVVVDALFGIGARLPIRKDAEKVLRGVRQALNDARQPESASERIITPVVPNTVHNARPYVVAVDCPSGLNADTGELDTNTFPADETVTFIAAKPGLLQFPGAGRVGKLHVATLGIPDNLPEMNADAPVLVDAQTARDLLPARSADSNKGTYGKALIVAGSVNYVGAPGLAAQAAYRVGAGLVTVGAPQPVVGALCGHLLEPTWLLLPHDLGVLAEGAAQLIRAELARYDALLLGPGWGREQATRDMLLKLLEKSDQAHDTLRAIGFALIANVGKSSEDVPDSAVFPALIVDADGLNLLSEIENWWTLLPASTIITPHPGEMARLAKQDTADIQKQRLEIAHAKAAEWNVVLLLKGAHTVIAEPGGRMAVIPFKTDALATAGTGDVLAGAITGLLAQGLKPFDAAVVAAYLHGLAGVQAAKNWGSTRSVMAGDVLDALGHTFWLLEDD